MSSKYALKKKKKKKKSLSLQDLPMTTFETFSVAVEDTRY